MKTFELLSIVGSVVAVGITLGAVIVASNANLHAELRAEMRTDIRALESRLLAVEQRLARTEGLLEGLRDAITAQGLVVPRGENEAT